MNVDGTRETGREHASERADRNGGSERVPGQITEHFGEGEDLDWDCPSLPVLQAQ